MPQSHVFLAALNQQTSWNPQAHPFSFSAINHNYTWIPIQVSWPEANVTLGHAALTKFRGSVHIAFVWLTSGSPVLSDHVIYVHIIRRGTKDDVYSQRDDNPRDLAGVSIPMTSWPVNSVILTATEVTTSVARMFPGEYEIVCGLYPALGSDSGKATPLQCIDNDPQTTFPRCIRTSWTRRPIRVFLLRQSFSASDLPLWSV